MSRPIDQYKILSELGAGGMGVVYRALDVSLDREVAIKRLRSEFAASAAVLERFRKEADFAAIVPTSAIKGAGLDALLDEIFHLLPESDPYFPEDQVTDQPERFLAAEIIREKAIRALHHELPYAVAVFVEKFEQSSNFTRIEALLNVERDTQKKILIGHKGAMLKKIGTEARKELESLLGTKVFLGLFVKVAPDWRENPQRVRELDWHFQLEGLSAAQADQEDEPSEDRPE